MTAASTHAFRFVHCSDVHLDSPFRCANDDVRARLAAGNRLAFQRVVDLCLSEKVHALLIAGDLFDDERLAFSTEDYLVRQVSRLTSAGIHVLVAAGNHDPGGDGKRTATIEWPTERCSVLRGNFEQVLVHGADGKAVGRVIGAGHASSDEAGNLLAQFSTPHGHEPCVALLHCHVEEAAGAANHPRLAPCTIAELSALGCRYVALGHVHRRQRLGDHAIHYSGTLCGHHAGETGAHGALLVSITAKGEPQVEFRALSPVRWETLEVAGLELVRDLAGLKHGVHAAFAALRAAPDALPDQQWMLRVPLHGASPLAAELQEDDLLEEFSEELTAELSAQGVLDVAVVDEGTSLPFDLQPHRGQPHVLGLSLEVVDALAEDGKLLAHLAPAALAGLQDGAEKSAYLRSLLSDLDRAAAEALLKETLA